MQHVLLASNTLSMSDCITTGDSLPVFVHRECVKHTLLCVLPVKQDPALLAAGKRVIMQEAFGCLHMFSSMHRMHLSCVWHS